MLLSNSSSVLLRPLISSRRYFADSSSKFSIGKMLVSYFIFVLFTYLSKGTIRARRCILRCRKVSRLGSMKFTMSAKSVHFQQAVGDRFLCVIQLFFCDRVVANFV